MLKVGENNWFSYEFVCTYNYFSLYILSNLYIFFSFKYSTYEVAHLCSEPL